MGYVSGHISCLNRTRVNDFNSSVNSNIVLGNILLARKKSGNLAELGGFPRATVSF